MQPPKRRLRCAASRTQQLIPDTPRTPEENAFQVKSRWPIIVQYTFCMYRVLLASIPCPESVRKGGLALSRLMIYFYFFSKKVVQVTDHPSLLRARSRPRLNLLRKKNLNVRLYGNSLSAGVRSLPAPNWRSRLRTRVAPAPRPQALLSSPPPLPPPSQTSSAATYYRPPLPRRRLLSP